ncbi:MAG: AAA family ATPase [Paracoccaceae bacterium]
MAEHDADTPEQAEVVALMTDPATHDGAAVEHVETHLSHVFLAGEYAWKVKRAVRRDFVDFSTLDARRAACEAEIRVNTRTAPDIYLGVAAIRRAGEGLVLDLAGDGGGEAVDYAVRMRRFADDVLFSHMAERGRLTPAHLRGLADVTAALHRAERPVAPGRPLDAIAATLRRELAEAAAGTAVEDAAAGWDARFAPAFAAVRPGIEARARHGAVREGHGDLHLANVCLFEGRVRPFDAIEFDPGLSRIDGLYDLAFALMDLAHRDARALGCVLLSRYLSATRDYGWVDLLAPMMSLRAAIRAMVALISPGAEREATARDLLATATRLLDPPPPPRLVVVGGRSGTGKSRLAAALAPALAPVPQAVVLRSDEIRKRLAGVAPETRLPPAAYTRESAARVYRRMLRDGARVLGAGGTAVLDGAFLDPEERRAAEAAAARAGAAFHGLWLSAGDDVLEGRIAARSGDASDADAAVMRAQPDPAPTGPGWRRIDAGRAPEAVEAEARGALGFG